MIEAVPMRASMALSAGYKIGNAHPDDIGYEVTYPDGYKSWSPAKEFEKAYYKLEDPAGDILRKDDIKRFISNIENVKVGTKTTNTTLTCLTGFEVHGQAWSKEMILLMLMVYMLYLKLALIELALFNLMVSLDPLRVLRTLRYTPRRGWNGSYASNISIVINDNDYID